MEVGSGEAAVSPKVIEAVEYGLGYIDAVLDIHHVSISSIYVMMPFQCGQAAGRVSVSSGMSVLPSKWVRLAPKETNQGLFQIRFQYILESQNVLKSDLEKSHNDKSDLPLDQI